MDEMTATHPRRLVNRAGDEITQQEWQRLQHSGVYRIVGDDEVIEDGKTSRVTTIWTGIIDPAQGSAPFCTRVCRDGGSYETVRNYLNYDAALLGHSKVVELVGAGLRFKAIV